MAYLQTTGSSPDDVIQKIADFASSLGWSIEDNVLTGSNRRLVLKRTNSDYLQLWNTDGSSIFVTGFIGYDSSLSYNQQSGYAGNYAQCRMVVGPYSNLFLFGDNDPSPHVHAVIELPGGVFRHLSFGILDKLGTWTGGTYFDATIWASNTNSMNAWNGWSGVMFDYARSNAGSRWGAVRCDIPADGIENSWAHFRDNQAHRVATGLDSGSMSTNGRGYLTFMFYNRNNPPFSGQVALGTISAAVIRPGSFFSPIGTVPNIRYLTMARFAPGQEVTVGSDVWKIIPFCRKGTGPTGQEFSGNHAFAFKKVT